MAIGVESKYNSKILSYIAVVIDTVGLVYTLLLAFKKDKEKYLKN